MEDEGVVRKVRLRHAREVGTHDLLETLDEPGEVAVLLRVAVHGHANGLPALLKLLKEAVGGDFHRRVNQHVVVAHLKGALLDGIRKTR